MVVKILVVDQDKHFRSGLCRSLQDLPDIAVIGEAANGREAIEHAMNSAADVIVMEVKLPPTDGIEVCKTLKLGIPNIRILMLTTSSSEMEVFSALGAGANGYCLKTADISRIIMAIKSVANEDYWLDSGIAGRIMKLIPEEDRVKAPKRRDKWSPFRLLSPRELEVLNLLVQGMSNAEIAKNLTISTETVKSHAKSIMDKLAVNNRTQIVIKVLKSSLF